MFLVKSEQLEGGGAAKSKIVLVCQGESGLSAYSKGTCILVSKRYNLFHLYCFTGFLHCNWPEEFGDFSAKRDRNIYVPRS